MGSASSKAAKSNPIQKLSKNSNGSGVRNFPKRSSKPPLSTSEHLRPHQNSGGERVDDVTSATTTRPHTDNDDLNIPLSKRLQQLGPVQPAPKTFEIHQSSHLRSPNLQSSKQVPSLFSNLNSSNLPVLNPTIKSNKKRTIDRVAKTASPANNPAITLLSARSRFAKEAEAELTNVGKSGFKGRRFLDLETIRQVLVMRHANGEVSNEEIERRLCLSHGVLNLLGKRGIVDIIE